MSLLISQMFNLGQNVSLIKLRGGWAQVGKDTNPYELLATYANEGQWGSAVRWGESGTLLTPNLIPESAISMEFGTDLGFFNHRLRFEGTYFVEDNKNQIIRNVPDASSSGYGNSNLNMGLTQSKGWEFTIGGVPVKNNDWIWDVSVNVTRVRVTLKELDANNPNVNKIQFWDDSNAGSWAYIGDQIGDIYGSEIMRVTDEYSPYFGYPIIIGGGGMRWEKIPIEATKHKIGNYNPDFILGLNSTLSYKNFSLNWTIDWRYGGQFVSQSERRLLEDGYSATHLKDLINPNGREGKELKDWLVANEDKYIKNGFNVIGGPTKEYGGFRESLSGRAVNDGCFVPGVYPVYTPRGELIGYKENLGEDGTKIYPYIFFSPWDFGEGSMFPADYVKLREISLTYQIPSKKLDRIGIKGLAVSVYSRNIMLWTKAPVSVDPERAFQPEGSTEGKRGTQFKQGIEMFNLEPWVVPVGFKLNLTF
jgi:hypothetical protein